MTEQNAMVPGQPGALTFGQTALRADQFVPPRVKIVQLMSDERATGRANVGDFFNTLTGESYGPSLKFLPLQPFMNRVLLVRDENEGKVTAIMNAGDPKGKWHFDPDATGVLKCRSLDMIQGVGEPGIPCDTCPLSRWGPGNTPPPCTEVYNVAVVTELGDLAILQFQRSSAKTGKRLFSMLRFVTPGQAPWTRFYRADTHEVNIPGKGSFAVADVSKTPEVPPTELIRQCQSWASQLAGFGPIDVTPIDEDEVNDEGGGSEDAPF
jgi:hypothetical protein